MELEIENVKNAIEKIRPFILNHGGDIEFIKYENNIVYISLIGACAGCSMLDATLKGFIEEAIISEVPSVKEVVNIR